MTELVSQLDPRALRDAFGCFMTGVTIVTSVDPDGKPVGFTANSFSSVSLDPPLLLVSIANRSSSLATFVGGKGFAVNVLTEQQRTISNTFARPSENRFAEVAWFEGLVGSPLIRDVSAWFDCTLEKAVEAGDHTILIGRIGAFGASPAPGLGYYRGAYFTPAATSGQLPTNPDVVISAIIEADGKILLVDDEHGGAKVPTARVGREGIQTALKGLIERCGVTAGTGSLYSVYEDERNGTQNIALRCPAAEGKPSTGRFVELRKDCMESVSDTALRQMLERLAEETHAGNFGVYFGTYKQGHVQRSMREQLQ